MAGFEFDATDVPPRDEFEPIPPGVYTTMIVASEIKTTTQGGKMLVLELDVQDGEYSGRKLFERLNIENANETAVQIAYKVLGEIVRAVGKITIKSDTEELHNIRLLADVRVDPPRAYKDKTTGEMREGKPQNSIKKYIPFTAAKAAPVTKKNVAEPKTKPVVDAGAPWRRKK